MAQQSLIEWTDATWNPWHGCVKVSDGCKHCYMYRGKERYGKNPKEVTRSRTTFADPLKWEDPRLIFACSWSDWFIAQADSWRDEAWEIIKKTPHHTYQILTKRPERIRQSLPRDWGDGWDNVWLGVSIEDQEHSFRKDLLQTITSKTRFISAEPLLGPIQLGSLYGIHWVITGGESGPKARPMNPDWARSIRSQCAAARVAFFHKQNGGTTLVNGSWGGRVLDGRTWDDLPSGKPPYRPSGPPAQLGAA
jgi:protein gp37